MRIGVISDIHSNLEACQAALGELEDADQIVCLGDLVGYGPNPNECCDMVRSLGTDAVIGNHDMAVVGRLESDWFNYDARRAVEWTSERITEENSCYLGGLPERLMLDGYELAHGSPEDPSLYIVSPIDAHAAFEKMEKAICFFGHTHVACFFERSPEGTIEGFQIPNGGRVELKEGHKYMFNPGAVGQPRDGNPRCGLALYNRDSEAVEFLRVDYQIERTQQKMQQEGLPDALWQRLQYGW